MYLFIFASCEPLSVIYNTTEHKFVSLHTTDFI